MPCLRALAWGYFKWLFVTLNKYYRTCTVVYVISLNMNNGCEFGVCVCVWGGGDGTNHTTTKPNCRHLIKCISYHFSNIHLRKNSMLWANCVYLLLSKPKPLVTQTFIPVSVWTYFYEFYFIILHETMH